MKYYVRIGADAPKILTAEEILALIQQGTITPTTKACAVGAASWSDICMLLPSLFQPNPTLPPPPAEHGAMEFMGKLAEQSGEVASLAKVFARRIFASNFAAEAALPEERALLEKSEIPIRSPMAQNYVAWRRAILWVAGVALALAGLITFIDEFKVIFGDYVPPVLRFILLGTQALNFLAPVLIIHAALRWDKVRHSRRWARFGWLCQFLGPIILLLLPVKEMTTNEQLAGYLVEIEWSTQKAETEKQIEKTTDSAARTQMKKNLEDQEKAFRDGAKDQIAKVKAALDSGQKKWEDLRKDKNFKFDMNSVMGNQEVGAYLGGTAILAAGMTLTALMTLLPRIFGMFPGIVRASLTLRTLVPESPLPGYVAALIEPLYVLLVLIVVVIASQISQWLIFDGLICLIVSAYFLVRNARTLSKPMDSASMTAHLKPLRKKMLICTVIGLIFIVAGISDYISSVGFWRIFSIVSHLIGNIILLTAVGADFLLGLMKFSFDQDRAMRGTPLQADLDNRFADLAQARLAQISDEPPPPIAPEPPPVSSTPR